MFFPPRVFADKRSFQESFPFWAITAAGLLALVAYAFWLGSLLPYHNDLFIYDYPEKTFNLESLRKGLLPLWNPYLGCGTPHLANWQSSFFYPPNLLFSITGVSRGMDWLLLAHAAWAYLGFFLWARAQKIQGWICALGALSFAASAHLVLCWVNLHFLATASWIPWVFWSVQRALHERRLSNGLTAILVLSLQLLAGYPIFVFYTWFVLFVWVALQRPLLPALGRTGLLLAVSLALTAAQW